MSLNETKRRLQGGRKSKQSHESLAHTPQNSESAAGTQTTVTTSPTVKWYDRHSPTVSTARGEAEDELLALSNAQELKASSTVLNLAGLWGGTRSMKNWVGRVVPTKESLLQKASYISYFLTAW